MNRGDVKLIIDRCVAHDVPDAATLIERQAAQIEMMREALEAGYNGLRWWMDAFPMHVTEADNEEMLKLVKTLSTTPDQALEQFAERVREQCAKVCDTADKSTHPADLANAIRAIKKLP